MSAWTMPRTQARTWAASASFGSRPSSSANARSRWSMTVLRNIARMAGAAIDRHRHNYVLRAQVEAVIKDAHVVERGDRHPGRADLAVDVRPPVGVAP